MTYQRLNIATEAEAHRRLLEQHAKRTKRGKDRDATSPVRFGFVCSSPFMRENVETGVMGQFRCGKCDGCWAHKRNQMTGKAFAAMEHATFVYMFTLTAGNEYRGDWNKREVKNFQQWLRDDAARRGLGTVEFMRAPEVGDSEQHTHYHTLAYYYGDDPGWKATPVQKNGRAMEHWRPDVLKRRRSKKPREPWPCGLLNIRVLKQNALSQYGAAERLRYPASYVGKQARRPGMPRVSISVGRRKDEDGETFSAPLGWRVAKEHGERCAKLCLPLKPIMEISGFTGSKVLHIKDGPRRGEVVLDANGKPKRSPQHFELTGALARVAVSAYKKTWAQTWAHISMDDPRYESVLRKLHDPDYIEPVGRKPRHGFEWLPRADIKRLRREPQRKRDGCEGVLPIHGKGGSVIGLLSMSRDGFCRFWLEQEEMACEGARKFRDGSLAVPNGTLRDVVKLNDDAHEAVEQWIAEKRGPEWADWLLWQEEKRALEDERIKALRRAFHGVTRIGRGARRILLTEEHARDGPLVRSLEVPDWMWAHFLRTI